MKLKLEKQLSKEKNEKVIGLMKDVIGGKIMTSRPKKYGYFSYLAYDNDENKKGKYREKCKTNLKFKGYKNGLAAN